MSSAAEHNAMVAACRQEYGYHPDVRLFLNSKVEVVRGQARAKPGLGSGTADIVAIARGGIFCHWEGKTGLAVETPRQRLVRGWIEQMGGHVGIFHGVPEFGALVADVSAKGKALVAFWSAVSRVGLERVREALEKL